MKVMTKEERENAFLGGIVLLILSAMVGIIVYFGAGPTGLLVVCGVLAIIAGSSLAVNFPKIREYRRLAQKTHIAELEAATGLAVIQYEGKCSKCGGTLVAGALHCTHCGTATDRKPKICQYCAAPNPDDALYCASCGKSIV